MYYIKLQERTDHLCHTVSLSRKPSVVQFPKGNPNDTDLLYFHSSIHQLPGLIQAVWVYYRIFRNRLACRGSWIIILSCKRVCSVQNVRPEFLVRPVPCILIMFDEHFTSLGSKENLYGLSFSTSEASNLEVGNGSNCIMLSTAEQKV